MDNCLSKHYAKNSRLKYHLYLNVSAYLILFILLILFTLPCHAAKEQEPPKIGNFAVPNSQQPGPLIGFGENIIDKNQTQIFFFADDYAGVKKHFVDIIPAVLYGITANLSVFLNAPYAASYKEDHNKSSGFEDAFAQLEYAFYNKSTSAFVDQATVVVNATVPTGSMHKNPPTGMGSPSFFLGTTYNRTSVDWIVFGSPGVNLTTTKNHTKYGNSYLYQFGLARNISYTKGWILDWMIEIDGTYSQRDRVQGSIDPNSGGNVVYVNPSIWTSTNTFLFQFAVGLPVTQHLYGNQKRNSYLLALNMGWSFY